MSKEDIMELIDVINKQLEENKKAIEACAERGMFSDSDVMTLCTLSKMLISAKQMWKETLLIDYGVYYIG
jgi:hypothetical protein